MIFKFFTRTHRLIGCFSKLQALPVARPASSQLTRFFASMATTLFDWVEEKGLVSLGVGAPDKMLLAECSKIMLSATQDLLSTETSCLQYGPSCGDTRALRELAKFLSDQYRGAVYPENLMFNAGASQGLKLLAGTLMQQGDTVFVEDPTYFIAITALKEDLGLNVIPVPTDEGGVIVEELDQLLTKHSAAYRRPLTKQKPFSSLVYVMPTFNNPTGSVLGEDRSLQMIKVLRKHNSLAICDDVYNALYFDESKPPPRRLFSYDNTTDRDYQGNVLSNGSFSKLLGPGLRLGWVEGPTHLLSLLTNSGYACSGGCFNHYTACVVGKAIELGLVSKHVVYSRKVFHSRMTALCDAIDKYMPTAEYVRPEGGFFVWVMLPSKIKAQKVLEICQEKYKVLFHIGPKCSCVGHFPNCLRLSFAYYTEEVLIETVRKIGMAHDEVAKNTNNLLV